MKTKQAMSTRGENLKSRLGDFFNSIMYILPAGFFFALSNFLIIVFLYLSSGFLLFEIFKWVQLLALIIILSASRKYFGRYAAFPAVFFLYYFYLILVSYVFSTGARLDFSFLRRNAGNIGSILPEFYDYLLILAFISFANSLFIYKLKFVYENRFKKAMFLILIIFAFGSFFIKADYSNEFVAFFKSIRKNDEIISYYQSFYQDYLDKTDAINRGLADFLAGTKTESQPAFLENIIILQLESLNGFLASPGVTPNFIKIAKEGIFFPRFYANSVQTILSQETLLCSVPNSFDFNLAVTHKEIICLPRILKNAGYKTFFYKSYDLGFANTGEFMNALEFDHVHADDIMQEGDPASLWGYREDVFYERAFYHFSLNKQARRNFLFIQIGPTNHWPFRTPAGLEGQVPYPAPASHRERLSNTIFLQDKYLETAWQKIRELFPDKNYTLFVLGDHSWPAEFHAGNTFNESNAYEENFTTALALVVGNEYKGRVINSAYSQMDILPSIVELFGAIYQADDWRRSFMPELKNQEILPANVLQIQPYSVKYINIIEGGRVKYQYSAEEKKFVSCRLENDPLEKNCLMLGRQKSRNLEIIKELLPFEARD